MKTINYTNEKDYGLSVAVWLADSEYDHSPVEGPYVSVTGLLKPIRMIILDQRLKVLNETSDTSEVMDLDRFIPSRLGTAIHDSIEHSWTRLDEDGKPAYRKALRRLGYPEDVILAIHVNPNDEELKTNPDIIPVYLEQRSFKVINGYTVGGKFDFIGNGVSEDFLSMGSWGFIKDDKDSDFIKQLSMYHWLNPDKITEDWAKIQKIITDWNKLEALKGAGKGYPENRIVEKILDLMTVEETEAWVTDKIDEIKSYEGTDEQDLPVCTQKELWQDDPVFKYYGRTKKGTISMKATKSFDDSASAYAHKTKEGDGEVKAIYPKAKRCGYCAAFTADICTQGRELMAAGLLQLP